MFTLNFILASLVFRCLSTSFICQSFWSECYKEAQRQITSSMSYVREVALPDSGSAVAEITGGSWLAGIWGLLILTFWLCTVRWCLKLWAPNISSPVPSLPSEGEWLRTESKGHSFKMLFYIIIIRRKNSYLKQQQK